MGARQGIEGERLPPATRSRPSPPSVEDPGTPVFEQFYEMNRDAIGRSLALTLGDAALGFDAADEAMTRAYERWNDIRDGANPAGWVYRTGLNWARSWHRRRRRALAKAPLIAQPDTHVDSPVDTDLAAALARLSDEQRSVVVLRYFNDWTVDDTSAALDIAPGTVKSRLSRALDQLNAHLTHPPSEESDR